MDPPLSSVDQPGFEMGQEAARLLIRQIEMKDKEQFDPMPETKILKVLPSKCAVARPHCIRL